MLGAIDGLNVCNLSLLLLFITIGYSTGASRRTILVLGTSYISGAFVSYMVVGLGLLTLSINIPFLPHFLARTGISIMIIVGLFNILSYFRINPLPHTISHSLGMKSINYMKKAGYFSSLMAGMLAGLHNFPCACTGGVYPTFVSLIADTSNSILLLIAYNLLFIFPLVVILYVAADKKIVLKIRRWHQTNSELTRLIIGIAMIMVSVALLILTLSNA
jgi:cytochrome c biogenesis protein CcdA